jgi:hypothetical protein
MAQMVSALEPFTEYMTKLANGQLDTYFKSIQPERVTGLGVDLPNGPMLLLHSLGDYPDDARLPKLFRCDTVFASFELFSRWITNKSHCTVISLPSLVPAKLDFPSRDSAMNGDYIYHVEVALWAGQLAPVILKLRL